MWAGRACAGTSCAQCCVSLSAWGETGIHDVRVWSLHLRGKQTHACFSRKSLELDDSSDRVYSFSFCCNTSKAGIRVNPKAFASFIRKRSLLKSSFMHIELHCCFIDVYLILCSKWAQYFNVEKGWLLYIFLSKALRSLPGKVSFLYNSFHGKFRV